MKVLNLYACLGGNRLLWHCPNLEVTAVEIDPFIANLYQERFPNDRVIIADAHQYLLEHFNEYDFVWSSPPCQSHSRAGISQRKKKPAYPKMELYQEILLLKHQYKGLYSVENVLPYYEPLIPGKLVHRHLFWSNFYIPHLEVPHLDIVNAKLEDLESYHNIKLPKSMKCFCVWCGNL